MDPAVAAIAARRWFAPQREDRAPKGLDALWFRLIGEIPRRRPRSGLLRSIARVADAERSNAETLSERALTESLAESRVLIRLGRADRDDTARAIGRVAEAARRTVGLRAHPEQLIGSAGLERGCCVEMATGEGKTLVAAIAGVLAGWRGAGCHVFTANDYLARRDADWAAPLFGRCALSVGFVIDGMDPAERRAMYARDAVYTTGREAAADYLRDSIVIRAARRGRAAPGPLEEAILNPRGPRAAIVDEADAVLIDEAVTPLILSGPSENPSMEEAVREADHAADSLSEGQHFLVDLRYKEVRLTPGGRGRVESLLTPLGAMWASARRREELITNALHARALMLQGRDYVILDGSVVIVDEFTGRVTPDRTWRDGLHQAVEAKEGLTLRPMTVTHARISFQRFFGLYPRLCGMTGTAREAAGELWRTYRLPVVRVPTHEPVRRRSLGRRSFARADEKWNAIAAEIERVCGTGRPVLVGTRSVAASERLSAMLTERSLPHAVLNAVRHEEEADIIARAGERSRVTVATNMAGRGTDIRLGEGVRELGGLHVIATEPHEARRIDRQLFGRAGRQGDPGTTAAFIARDEELLRRFAGAAGRFLPLPLAHAIAVRRAERAASRARARVRRQDDWIDDALGFTGAER